MTPVDYPDPANVLGAQAVLQPCRDNANIARLKWTEGDEVWRIAGDQNGGGSDRILMETPPCQPHGFFWDPIACVYVTVECRVG